MSRLRQFLDATAEKPAQRNTAFALILLLLLGEVMAACSSAPDPQADQSFLTDQPCAAPCWYGLVLDKSTKAETVSLLQRLAFVNSASITEQGTSWGGDDTARVVSFDCVHPQTQKGSCGSALFSGDKLRWLWLSVGFELTLKMVIDKLGTPNYVDYGVEMQGCTATVAWPEKNIAVLIQEDIHVTVCQSLRDGKGMSAGLKPNSLYYSDTQTLQAGPAGCCKRITWPGFSIP